MPSGHLSEPRSGTNQIASFCPGQTEPGPQTHGQQQLVRSCLNITSRPRGSSSCFCPDAATSRGSTLGPAGRGAQDGSRHGEGHRERLTRGWEGRGQRSSGRWPAGCPRDGGAAPALHLTSPEPAHGCIPNQGLQVGPPEAKATLENQQCFSSCCAESWPPESVSLVCWTSTLHRAVSHPGAPAASEQFHFQAGGSCAQPGDSFRRPSLVEAAPLQLAGWRVCRAEPCPEQPREQRGRN